MNKEKQEAWRIIKNALWPNIRGYKKIDDNSYIENSIWAWYYQRNETVLHNGTCSNFGKIKHSRTNFINPDPHK